MQRTCTDPVAILPRDLLSEVFLYVKPLLGHHGPVPQLRSRPPEILCLGHVSRSWRAVAFSFPLLWDSVDLVLPRRKANILAEILQEWMERSRTCRLNIALCFFASSRAQPLDHGSEAVLQVLLKQAHRWYNVTLCLPLAALDIIDRGLCRFPMLEFFRFSLLPMASAAEWHATSVPGTIKFLDRAPNIRLLRLAGVGLQANGAALPHLAQFESLRLSEREIQDVLGRTPNLKHMEVESDASDNVEQVSPPRNDKPLSHLKVIKNRGTARLLHIMPDNSMPNLWRPLGSDLFLKQNTYHHLHTLGLSGYYTAPLHQICGMVDSVVTFCFIARGAYDDESTCILPEILDPIERSEAKPKPKVLLPNLENLYYLNSQSIQVGNLVANLVKMIKHRWNGYDKLMDPGALTHRHSGWVKIRSLHLVISKETMEGIIDQIRPEIEEGLKVYHSMTFYRPGGCDAVLSGEWALYEKSG